MCRCAWVGLFLFIIMAGCVTSRSLGDLAVADQNVTNLSRISLGMKESQVLKIMHPPYKQESYRLSDDYYHVWFYITTTTALGQSRMSPMNLTPLTFKNCKLVATGYSYYHWLKQKNKHIASKKPSKTLNQDEGLEKALQKSFAPNSTPPNEKKTLPKSQDPNQAPPSQVKIAPDSSAMPLNQKKTGPQEPVHTPAKNQQTKGSKIDTQVNQGKAQPKPQGEGGQLKNQPQPSKTPNEPSKEPSPYNYGPLSISLPLAMSSPPKQSSPLKEPTPEEPKSDSSEKIEWDEKDSRAIEEESEQNFNFW